MATCLTPYYVKNNRYGIDAEQVSKIPVPCGRCPTCIERRTNQWVLRLTEHEKVSRSSLFITLTYSTDHVPITNNGFLTLSKTDVQKFFKRLRKHHKGDPIKYYLVGEYGTSTRRPHYHAIIFNVSMDAITKAWQMGETHSGQLTTNSIAYTCKYMAKQTVHRKKHGRDDRLPEFSLCSKKLGLTYVDKRGDWHKDDLERNYAVMPGGVKVPLPRYYKERLYSEDQRKKQGLLAKFLEAEKEDEVRSAYVIRTGDQSDDGFRSFQKAVLDAKLEHYPKMQEKNRKKL